MRGQVAKVRGLHLYAAGFLRRMYDWVLSWADRKHSQTALFLLAFAESSFFPIPPDVLQMALSVAKPRRSFVYAAVAAAGSVLGGMAGYLIGMTLWDALGGLFFRWIPGFSPELFELIRGRYEQHGFWIVFTAGFTPIPYKIITVSAGVFGIGFGMFVLASAVSRSARFFLVAALIYRFGPRIREFVERYFNLLTVVFLVLLLAGFAALKLLSGGN